MQSCAYFKLSSRAAQQTARSKKHSVKLTEIQRAAVNLGKYLEQLRKNLGGSLSILINTAVRSSCPIRRKLRNYS